MPRSSDLPDVPTAPDVPDLPGLAEAGYLPTRVDPAAGLVHLTRLAHQDFREVWYDDTVAAAGAGDEQAVAFSAFVDAYADRRPGDHLRVIAHTSRCGSTLLANLLTLRTTTMVLKEPDFVTVPARAIALAADEAEARAFESLLTALLNYTCHAAAAAGREPVVKITSWTVPLVTTALADSESTSWLFLWREPDKVVASNMATPSTWGRDTENGRAARRLAARDGAGGACGAGGPDGDTAGFYADTWRRTVDSFLSADEGLRWRALDYRDLVADKSACLLATEDWFVVAPDALLPPGFEEESRRYSKGGRAEVFDPASAHLRSPLEPAAAQRVRAVTEQALTALRARSRHQLL
ncbi:hypothetical protein ABZW03_38835 [Kitasatospora sp. NPDC004799]|uniref:hypothetical protein n=1 Tax=Kitasatospora sp. NPDC004799 TaxID=3154460 RepID=UPI0033BD8A05